MGVEGTIVELGWGRKKWATKRLILHVPKEDDMLVCYRGRTIERSVLLKPFIDCAPYGTVRWRCLLRMLVTEHFQRIVAHKRRMNPGSKQASLQGTTTRGKQVTVTQERLLLPQRQQHLVYCRHQYPPPPPSPGQRQRKREDGRHMTSMDLTRSFSVARSGVCGAT